MNYVEDGYVRSGYVRRDSDTIDDITFDLYGLFIELSTDIVSIDLAVIRSRMVDWMNIDENDKALKAMRYSGFDVIPTGNTGATFFMINNWRLVLDNAFTAVQGVLYSENYNTGYWRRVNDIWSPLNPVTVSAVVNTVTVAQSVLTDIQDKLLAMTAYQHKAVYINTDALSNGDGSAISPFDNVNDGKDFAEANGILTIYIYADITIPSKLKNFTIIGIGSPVVNCNGQDLKNTEFYGVKLQGTYTEKIKAKECILDDGFHLNGGFNTCSVVNHLICIDGGNVTLFNCFGNIANNAETNLSLNGLGSSNIAIVEFKGHLILSDVNNINDKVDISMPSDHLIIDASCILGAIDLAGSMKIEDNSGVDCIVNRDAVIDVEISAKAVWDYKL